jgi:hypothetical protein
MVVYLRSTIMPRTNLKVLDIGRKLKSFGYQGAKSLIGPSLKKNIFFKPLTSRKMSLVLTAKEMKYAKSLLKTTCSIIRHRHG